MSVPLSHIIDWLEKLAPPALAEDWDNVGLLLGDRSAEIHRAMACLTLTPDVADEAVRERVDLIVSHHPILFRPIQKLTTDSSEGAMLLKLIRAGVQVYSPHTAFDSSRLGINQQWAEQLDLRDIAPLRPDPPPGPLPEKGGGEIPGGGRWGLLGESRTLAQLLPQIRAACGAKVLQFTGDLNRAITRIGVACGSAGEFLADAQRAGCELFITGETRFHTQLEAREMGMCLVLTGHYASERPGVERLAELLAAEFPQLAVHAGRSECDPVQWSVST